MNTLVIVKLLMILEVDKVDKGGCRLNCCNLNVMLMNELKSRGSSRPL